MQRVNARAGYTLTEVVIVTALTVLILGGVMSISLNLARTYRSQKQINAMHQNLFACLGAQVRDLRMAGCGVHIQPGTYTQWVDWVSGVTDVVHIVDGGTSTVPDSVSITATFGAPLATLTLAVPRRSTQLHIAPSAAAAFNTTTRKLILVGKTEVARIRRVTGGILTISADPVVEDRALRYEYPAGTPIELIEVITYAWRAAPTNAFPFRPYVVRDDNTGLVTNDLQKMVGLDIENMQFTRDGRGVDIEMTARTPDVDPFLVRQANTTWYRRKTVSTGVRSRNL